MKRNTFTLITIFLLIVQSAGGLAQGDNPAERTNVIIYPYSGPKEGFTSNQFVMFFDTTTTNLMAELEAIFHIDIQKSTVEKDIHFIPVKIIPLNPEHPKSFLSQDDMERMWSRNRRILEILSGSITENPQRSGYTIISRIYSDAFAVLNSGKQVVLMDDSSRHTTKDFLDGHHMTILFTMAMDAKEHGKPSWMIARLLRKAFEIGRQVDAVHSLTTQMLIKKITEELNSIESASSGGSSP
jgi:hypothetical protein